MAKYMQKKKILIVSRSFYPMKSPRSYRTTELVKEFAREGHEVTLLTVKNDEVHQSFENEYRVIIKDLGPLRFPEVSLEAANRPLRLMKRILRRGLHLFLEYPHIELVYRVKKALERESSYDLLISIAVPHTIHWGVAAARKANHPIAQTWVADCGDPYMGESMDSFRKMFYFKYLEKWFCRKADVISVPIEEAKEAYYSEFRKKIRAIPQGFDFDEININSSGYTPNEIPTFAYAGGLIPGGRDPSEFLDYLVSLDQSFRFILYTRNKNMVRPYLDRAEGRIAVKDYIPREKLLKTLSRMDFLVNFENKTSLQLPSKLIDYHLAGRPVLSVNNSQVETRVVNQFLEGDYRGAYRYNGIDRYRIENVCNQFLRL